MSTAEPETARSFDDAPRYDLGNGEPQDIEREIDATRADLRATLAALERRFSVERLVDATVGRIRERGGEFAGNLTDVATQNPVPVLLTSIGLAWMMMMSRRGTGEHGSTSRSRERMAGIRDGASHAADTVHGAVDSTRDTLRHATQSSRDTLRSATQSSREAFEHTADSLRSGAARAAAATREGVEYARTNMDRLLHEQPLMLGAVGLAVGALIGALVPATEHEDRFIGGVRDEAVKNLSRRTRAGFETVRENVASYGAPRSSRDEDRERPAGRPH